MEQPSAPAVEGARDDVPEGFEYPAQSVIPQLSDLGDVVRRHVFLASLLAHPACLIDP